MADIASSRRLLRNVDWDAPFARLALCHCLSVSGETLVAISLAGSFFFKVDPSQGREKVVLGLLFTMAPFAVVGPLIGPMIDRARGGHRAVIIMTMALRCLTAVLMMVAVANDSVALFPGAFAMLVLAKSYQVAKAAVVPSAVRGEVELVEANSKLQLLSGLGALVAGSLGGLLLLLGGEWVLAMTTLVFGAGTVAAWRVLPSAGHAEAAAPSVPVAGSGSRSFRTESSRTSTLRTTPLWIPAFAMSVLRMVVGFATFLMAFELRGEGATVTPAVRAARSLIEIYNRTSFTEATRLDLPVIELPPPSWYFGVIIAVSVVGGMVGAALAPQLRRHVAEERILTGSAGLAVIVSIGAMMLDGLAALVVIGAGVAVAAALGKQAFDAIVQRDVAEADRGGVFATFESRFQMTWVAGALVPSVVHIPISLGAAMMAVAAAIAVTAMVTGVLPRVPRGPVPMVRRRSRNASSSTPLDSSSAGSR